MSKNGYIFKIIIPRVQQRYYHEVILKIKEFMDYNLEFVINDFGIINYLVDSNISVKVILGRTLTKSLLYVPWNEYITLKESEDNKNNIMQFNIYDDIKIIEYKKLGIQGFEISNLESSKIENLKFIIDYILNQDMEIGIHMDNIIQTIGRSCPTLKALKENLRHDVCNNYCGKRIDIHPNKIFNGLNGLYEDFDKNFSFKYYIIENIVYREVFNNVDLHNEKYECISFIYDKKM